MFPRHRPRTCSAGKVVLEDFYWNEANQKIYLKILVPILEKPDGSGLHGRPGPAHRSRRLSVPPHPALAHAQPDGRDRCSSAATAMTPCI